METPQLQTGLQRPKQDSGWTQMRSQKFEANSTCTLRLRSHFRIAKNFDVMLELATVFVLIELTSPRSPC